MLSNPMEMDDLANDGAQRHSRLARKAESARQARLRHKQYVNELQEHVSQLQARILALDARAKVPSAHTAVTELRAALNTEQLAQITEWLRAAEGENHVLERYGRPMPEETLPAFTAPRVIPKPTRGGYSGRETTRSPMESDEETFSMSRSWDDIEGARSILNLNSPNGFHPLSLASSAPPTSFVLPVAARAPPPPSAAEMPERSHFTSFTPSAATPSVPIPPPRSMGVS